MVYEKAIRRADMIRCALCKDAPCSAACPKLDPADLLRSIWFDDEKVAAARLPEGNPCLGCDAPCEGACVRPHEVPIRDLVGRLYGQPILGTVKERVFVDEYGLSHSQLHTLKTLA